MSSLSTLRPSCKCPACHCPAHTDTRPLTARANYGIKEDQYQAVKALAESYSLADARKRVINVIKIHEHDPNFSFDLIEKFKKFLGEWRGGSKGEKERRKEKERKRRRKERKKKEKRKRKREKKERKKKEKRKLIYPVCRPRHL